MFFDTAKPQNQFPLKRAAQVTSLLAWLLPYADASALTEITTPAAANITQTALLAALGSLILLMIGAGIAGIGLLAAVVVGAVMGGNSCCEVASNCCESLNDRRV